MTKEELLEHHIMIPNHFNTDELLLYCDAGYQLLYKMRHNDDFILVIIDRIASPFPNYEIKLKDRYKCITDDSYNMLIYDFIYDRLITKEYKGYIRSFVISYNNIHDDNPRKKKISS